MVEEWKIIPGYENYKISNHGNIINLYMKSRLRPCFNFKKTHYTANLYGKDETYKIHQLHRLVLQAFVGPCPEGMQCCHNNGNGLDNRLENLRWDTTKSNCADQAEHGTKRLNERHHRSKLSNDECLTIKSISPYRGMIPKLAKYYNVSVSTIRDIIKGKTWSNL